MKNIIEKPATPDQVWKLLITKFFKEFLEVFKPDLLRDIIPEKTEFLEKELISLTGRRKEGIVDILAKVYLKNGKDEYVLFHTEVQGRKEKDFAERMYAYYIRIWDKYRKPVASIAVLTEKNTFSKSQNKFVIKSYKTSQIFKYTLIDVTKFSYNYGIKSKNPVRIVVCLLSSGSKEPKWKKKAVIIKRLTDLGLDLDKINILLAFVDRLKPMNTEELKKFDEFVVKNYKEEAPMILTSWEEKGIKKGLQRGRREGKLEGKREGKLEGKLEATHSTAANFKKSGVDISVIAHCTGLSEEEIKNL
jgi:predicted transposase/invertase (TIGR01784 family)